ncbi:MAG TPA: energy-coupling factor transporter ATPase [Candidatus Egerieicola pullicola]|uniref:Energy-coupling factor transporter ATP-binding protein EcfA2 n=1 Tax=Candidatus Egerieicola pullicola TaxID=2840775 RepID=A0A9D1DCV8_9FIRM|nr:energy-coupling factor transporter ATPase [Candidatus Egerieicola pullicola]
MIELKDVSYVYSPKTPFEKTALDHINLTIGEGEFIGVIGHTGSGKSTLIQHLNGLLRPTQGQVLFNGTDIWADKKNLRQVRFQVGLVFQYPEYQLFEETVGKDIAFGPTNMGLSQEEIQRRVQRAMEMVELPASYLDHSPFDLSGGQKRRVAIAGVIAMEPKVLILDEPTAGLDPRGRDLILQMIAHYRKATGSTVLLVSHSMEDVARYCEKVLVMNHSKVFAFDTVEQVFSRWQELEAMGLDVPQITLLFQHLEQKGYSISRHKIYTVPYGAQKLLEYLNWPAGKGDSHAE